MYMKKRSKRIRPIPLDINNPKCPREVIHSNIADIIRDMYSDSGCKVHFSLRKFLDRYPKGRGYEWESRVLTTLLNKPIELVEQWVNCGLPRGFFRAELRSYLKQHK